MTTEGGPILSSTAHRVQTVNELDGVSAMLPRVMHEIETHKALTNDIELHVDLGPALGKRASKQGKRALGITLSVNNLMALKAMSKTLLGDVTEIVLTDNSRVPPFGQSMENDVQPALQVRPLEPHTPEHLASAVQDHSTRIHRKPGKGKGGEVRAGEGLCPSGDGGLGGSHKTGEGLTIEGGGLAAEKPQGGGLPLRTLSFCSTPAAGRRWMR